MSQLNPEVYIRRNKLRRIFDEEFKKINNQFRESCSGSGYSFHVKYSSHLLDRAIQREIDETYVFDLFKKLSKHSAEVIEFLKLPASPDVEDEIDPSIDYRPLRLEITDGNLWLGMTVNRHGPQEKSFGLSCRMAFINNKRLKGKTSTHVINL